MAIPLRETDEKTLVCGTLQRSTNFRVEYKLKCFVKHASVFETGEGNCLEFPVKVVLKPNLSVEPEPFDRSYTVNAKTAEFNYQEDPCEFKLQKEPTEEKPCNMKPFYVSRDLEMHKKVFDDKIVIDNESD